ncbi:unnamed protein product [Cladocopium goreaui]|uniref:Uncharacterized protein n=1 Tax=Cladocopium goreaui TaxID=2562237 RepID=A0A9P1GLK4_9DINO|nr:unnamed protein product [Cladocopium goreaui]
MACCFGLLSKLFPQRLDGTAGTAPEGSRCADGNFALPLRQKRLKTQARRRQLKQFLLTGRDPTVWDRDNDWFPQENYWLPWSERHTRSAKETDEEGIPHLRASKLPDFFQDSRSEGSPGSPSGTDAQFDGAAPSWDGSLAGEIRSAGVPQSRMPIKGKILSKLPAGLLMDINRDSLGLLPWKELRNVPRKCQKIGSVLRNLQEAKMDEANDRIILKRSVGELEVSSPAVAMSAPVALPVRSVLMGRRRRGRNGPRT